MRNDIVRYCRGFLEEIFKDIHRAVRRKHQTEYEKQHDEIAGRDCTDLSAHLLYRRSVHLTPWRSWFMTRVVPIQAVLYPWTLSCGQPRLRGSSTGGGDTGALFIRTGQELSKN